MVIPSTVKLFPWGKSRMKLSENSWICKNLHVGICQFRYKSWIKTGGTNLHVHFLIFCLKFFFLSFFKVYAIFWVKLKFHNHLTPGYSCWSINVGLKSKPFKISQNVSMWRQHILYLAKIWPSCRCIDSRTARMKRRTSCLDVELSDDSTISPD